MHEKRCIIAAIEKTRVTLTLDKEAVNNAKAQGLNLSAIASDAIWSAAKQSEREAWIAESTSIIAAQDEWLERNGHPFAGAIAGPFGKAWKG